MTIKFDFLLPIVINCVRQEKKKTTVSFLSFWEGLFSRVVESQDMADLQLLVLLPQPLRAGITEELLQASTLLCLFLN